MPTRDEVVEARPPTSPAARRAAATTATAHTPPPIEHWVPPPVVVLVDHAPTNPSLRTLIRNALDIVLPRADTPRTSEAIRKWLVDNFHDTSVYKDQLKVYYDQGRAVPRLYQPASEQPQQTPTSGGARRVLATQDDPQPTAAPADPYPVDADGSFVMRGIRLSGVETGTARFEATIVYTGDVRIPADVVRQGRDAVLEYLRNNRRDLSESTENYLYHEEGFVSESVRLTTTSIPEDHLRHAIAVATGMPR